MVCILVSFSIQYVSNVTLTRKWKYSKIFDKPAAITHAWMDRMVALASLTKWHARVGGYVIAIYPRADRARTVVFFVYLRWQDPRATAPLK